MDDQKVKVKIEATVDLSEILREVEQLRQQMVYAAAAVNAVGAMVEAHEVLLWKLCNLDSRFKTLFDEHRAELEPKLAQLAAA